VTEFPLYEAFFPDGLDVDDDGRVAVPTAPGLGVELTDEIVERYGV
jgi:L-alanine-DL-glutamate epimerase-like enolase superfamily enzyme